MEQCPYGQGNDFDGSKIDSVFYPSDVDQMSTRNPWDLSG